MNAADAKYDLLKRKLTMNTQKYIPDYTDIAFYLYKHDGGTYEVEDNGVLFSITADIEVEYRQTYGDYFNAPEYALTDFYFNVRDAYCIDTNNGNDIPFNLDQQRLEQEVYEYYR